MNRADLVFAICHLIGLRAREPAPTPSWAQALAAQAPQDAVARPATR
jgi:hypothetical protein